MSRVVGPIAGINGVVTISGAKNSVLLLLAAAALATEKVVLHNVPRLADVGKMCEILNVLNVKTEWLGENTLLIDPSQIEYSDLDIEASGQIRTSVLFVGVMLGRFGRVLVSSPGGCKLGARPVNFHIDAMRAMGASINDDGKVIKGDLMVNQDANIHFGKVSVTGVVNAMLCAVSRQAKTTIHNCALEPEVDDCIEFLKKLGANIKRMGSTIVVQGGQVKGGLDHSVIPDRIEAGTFLILTMMVGGKIVLKDVRPQYMQALLDKLREAGASIAIGEDSIELEMHNRPKSCNIQASPYPGFPTDLQPQWGALSAISKGRAMIVDTVYPGRFDYMFELEKMGVKFEKFENGVVIVGIESLAGADVCARDLRGAAALVLAAKAATGYSKVISIEHLDRGYYQFFEKLEEVELTAITSK